MTAYSDILRTTSSPLQLLLPLRLLQPLQLLQLFTVSPT
jgi:hypothetical protein